MLIATATLCLALNIYHEARGEPLNGQIAVANVTMNRANQDERMVCSVVTESKQFSWTIGTIKHRSGKPVVLKQARPTDMKAWKRSLRIARYVLSGGRDETHGATYYHTKRVSPKWRLSLRKTKVIGKHIFYKEKHGSNKRHYGRQPENQNHNRFVPRWLGQDFWQQESKGNRWTTQHKN